MLQSHRLYFFAITKKHDYRDEKICGSSANRQSTPDSKQA